MAVAFFAIFGAAREDDFTGEIVGDFDVKNGISMDVATIGDERADRDGAAKSKTRDVVFENLAIADGFATDVCIKDTGELEEIIDHYFVFVFCGGRVLADEQSGVLAAGVGVFGNIDGEMNFLRFVGGEGAGGVFDSDPVGDFGIDVHGGEICGVVFAYDTVRSGGNSKMKILGGFDGIGYNDAAVVGISSSKRETLTHG